MSNQIEYKIATQADLQTMIDIRLEMLKIVNNLPDDYEFADEFVTCSRWYFEKGDQTTVLAFDGERAIGCASMSYIEVMPTFDHPTGRRAHLMNVYTNQNYRRQGIGKIMVEMLIEDAKKKGATEIGLDATTLGRPLYEALGFCDSESYMAIKL